MTGQMSLQQRAAAWHEQAAPDASVSRVLIKAMEELGEVARAFHGRGDIVAESADVVVALAVLVGRWYPDRDLLGEAEAKLDVMIADGRVYALGDGR